MNAWVENPSYKMAGTARPTKLKFLEVMMKKILLMLLMCGLVSGCVVKGDTVQEESGEEISGEAVSVVIRCMDDNLVRYMTSKETPPVSYFIKTNDYHSVPKLLVELQGNWMKMTIGDDDSDIIVYVQAERVVEIAMK